MLIKYWPEKTDLKFMNLRIAGALFSMVLIGLSAYLLGTRGLNFGVDFAGGTVMELAHDLDMAPEDLRYRVAGVNHVAFFLELTDAKGRDLYPALRQGYGEGRLPKPPLLMPRCPNKVRYEVMKHFGYFCTESSEHLAEYTPWFIKRARPDLIEQFGIPLDEYPKRCIEQRAEWQDQAAALTSGAPLNHTKSHEMGADIINAIVTDTPLVIHGGSGVPVAFGVLTTGTALMLTHSRAGFVSGMIGVFVALICFRFSKASSPRFGNVMIAGAVLLAVGGFAVSGAGLEKRFEYLEVSQKQRMHLCDAVSAAGAQALSTGYGYGTFEPGFRPFKDVKLSPNTWSLAHNSYLEFYFGTGLFGLVTVLAVFLLIFYQIVKSVFFNCKDTFYLIIGTSAMVIVGAHALTDFSLQMPAMGISFLFLFALGWRQSWFIRAV